MSTGKCDRCGETRPDLEPWQEPSPHGEYEQAWFNLCTCCRQLAWEAAEEREQLRCAGDMLDPGLWARRRSDA